MYQFPGEGGSNVAVNLNRDFLELIEFVKLSGRPVVWWFTTRILRHHPLPPGDLSCGHIFNRCRLPGHLPALVLNINFSTPIVLTFSFARPKEKLQKEKGALRPCAPRDYGCQRCVLCWFLQYANQRCASR